MRQRYIINKERALTVEELQRAIPAAFVSEPWVKIASPTYQHIQTSEILIALATVGYTPHSARQVGCRSTSVGKEFHTKHLITLKQDHSAKLSPVLYVLNSSDRSSSWQMGVGLFRAECLNFLLYSLAENFVSYRHRHVMKTTAQIIIEQALQLSAQFPALLQTVERFKAIQLSVTERLQFAEEALKLRYSKVDTMPYGPDRLLALRRYEDKGCSLFSTLNVVQENLLQSSRARWHGEKTSRAVGLTKSMELNKGVWQLAEDFALAR